jgi:hypothetical protein
MFLPFARVRFAAQRAKLDKTSPSSRRGSRVDAPSAYHADGILFLSRAYESSKNMPGEMNAAQWQKPMPERAQTMTNRSTRHIPEPGILTPMPFPA